MKLVSPTVLEDLTEENLLGAGYVQLEVSSLSLLFTACFVRQIVYCCSTFSMYSLCSFLSNSTESNCVVRSQEGACIILVMYKMLLYLILICCFYWYSFFFIGFSLIMSLEKVAFT